MERSGGSGFGPFGRAGARRGAARALAWVTLVLLGPAGLLWSCNRAVYALWASDLPEGRGDPRWTRMASVADPHYAAPTLFQR